MITFLKLPIRAIVIMSSFAVLGIVALLSFTDSPLKQFVIEKLSLFGNKNTLAATPACYPPEQKQEAEVFFVSCGGIF